MKPKTSTHAHAETAAHPHPDKTAVKSHTASSQPYVVVAHANPSTPETAAMKPTTTPTASINASNEPNASPAPALASAGTSPPAGSSAPPAASADTPSKLLYVKAPPKIILPAVPTNTVAVPRGVRSLLPRQEELTIVPDAESEIARFADYAGVFGKTAPSQAAVTQTLDAAYQWTVLRIALVAWAKYAKMQEANAWVSTRSLTGRLEPAFALAATTDPSIAAENPSLGSLLKVRSAIAKRGVARRATRTRTTWRRASPPMPGASARSARSRTRRPRSPPRSRRRRRRRPRPRPRPPRPVPRRPVLVQASEASAAPAPPSAASAAAAVPPVLPHS